MLKKFCSFANIVLSILLIIIITLSILFIFNVKRNPYEIKDIFGYVPMRILTGSMMPEIKPGDLVIVKKAPPVSIKLKDVVSFRTSRSTIVTHRVINIINGPTGRQFITKGDANSVQDYNPVEEASVIGTLKLIIPYGGYITNFTASWKGIILLFVLPIFLLIIGEFKTIMSDDKNLNIESDDIVPKLNIDQNEGGG